MGENVKDLLLHFVHNMVLFTKKIIPYSSQSNGFVEHKNYVDNMGK